MQVGVAARGLGGPAAHRPQRLAVARWRASSREGRGGRQSPTGSAATASNRPIRWARHHRLLLRAAVRAEAAHRPGHVRVSADAAHSPRRYGWNSNPGARHVAQLGGLRGAVCSAKTARRAVPTPGRPSSPTRAAALLDVHAAHEDHGSVLRTTARYPVSSHAGGVSPSHLDGGEWPLDHAPSRSALHHAGGGGGGITAAAGARGRGGGGGIGRGMIPEHHLQPHPASGPAVAYRRCARLPRSPTTGPNHRRPRAPAGVNVLPSR